MPHYTKEPIDFPRTPFAPGLEATQGRDAKPPPYKVVSFTAGDEPSGWVRVAPKKTSKKRQQQTNDNY